MLSDIASAVGKGLFAGLIGTAAMTVSSTLELRLTNRAAGDAPSKAAGKVLGVQPRNQAGRERFERVVHWTYGTAWGAFRGLISQAGISGPAAAALHFAAVWGAAQVLLPSLNVSPPATEWSPEELATDILHHAVYAAATSAAYDFIDAH